MDVLTQEFLVSYQYSVCFTEGLFDSANPVLREVVEAGADPRTPFRSRVAFIIEAEILRHFPTLVQSIHHYCEAHLPGALSSTAVLEVPGGEYSKNTPAILGRIYDFLHEQKVCRHSYAIVIGGGALIDAVGYAAATIHRGVRLIRVPTTVLAQNDAAIGVKNSINAYSKKNLIGTFAPAWAIINDFRFLLSLPHRDWIAGIAEAIKVSLIKDPVFFSYIEKHTEALLNRHMPTMQHVIRRCAELHLEHISKGGDPFERGSSRPLDFGHWAAHKIESLSGHSIRHGEAVAIGIELDATYSHLQGLISSRELSRINTLFDMLGLSKWREYLDLIVQEDRIENALNEFKEHLGGFLTITLIHKIGACVDVHTIDASCMKRAVRIVRGLSASRGRSTRGRVA